MSTTLASENKTGPPESPFRKILIGLDTSDESDRVIETAARLVRALDSQVEIVSVVNVPTAGAANEMDGNPANQKEIRLREEILERLHRHFGEKAQEIEVKVLHGDPPERISEYADYAKCDLIIVGSKRQGAFAKTILGSVSRSVVMKSHKSVLVVK
jgi:nucleotide-binding universal stress UspA family protein